MKTLLQSTFPAVICAKTLGCPFFDLTLKMGYLGETARDFGPFRRKMNISEDMGADAKMPTTKNTGRTISTLVHGSFMFVRFRKLKLSSSGG